MEDFIKQIDFALAHLLLRTSTYRPNGSDRLPKPKTPLILRSSTCVLSPVPPSAAKWSPRFAGKSRPPFAANASRKPAADRGRRKLQASCHSRPTQASHRLRLTEACRSLLSHPAIRGSSHRRSRLTQARRSREITPLFAASPGPPFKGDHAAVRGSPRPAVHGRSRRHLRPTQACRRQPQSCWIRLYPLSSGLLYSSQSPLLASAPQSPLLASAPQSPLLASAPQSPLLASALKCPRLPSALKCPRLPCALKCPRVPSAPKCPRLPSALKCPRLPSALKCPRLPSALKCPCLPSALKSPRLPRAKATDSPDPPWPPESPDQPWSSEPPASPWRPPVSPSWPSLQGAHPPSPVDMLRCGTHLLGGGDNVRVMDSLFFVFHMSLLSFLIWLCSCSC